MKKNKELPEMGLEVGRIEFERFIAIPHGSVDVSIPVKKTIINCPKDSAKPLPMIQRNKKSLWSGTAMQGKIRLWVQSNR